MSDEQRDKPRGNPREDDLDPRIGLAAAAPAPASLRARVLAGLAGEQAAISPRPGVTVVRTEATDWKACPFPGVQFKEVHRDRDRRARSILYRMEPGSKFPDHSHTFLEEIFVLEGSANLSGQLLRAGDYCRSDPGTEDFAISTDEGTTFLVFLTDEAERPRAK